MKLLIGAASPEIETLVSSINDTSLSFLKSSITVAIAFLLLLLGIKLIRNLVQGSSSTYIQKSEGTSKKTRARYNNKKTEQIHFSSKKSTEITSKKTNTSNQSISSTSDTSDSNIITNLILTSSLLNVEDMNSSCHSKTTHAPSHTGTSCDHSSSSHSNSYHDTSSSSHSSSYHDSSSSCDSSISSHDSSCW